MREFYSTVRVINAELKIRAAQGLEAVLEPKALLLLSHCHRIHIILDIIILSYYHIII